VTDPSFRIGQSTTVHPTGAAGATAAGALPDDDEPTSRSMALNFADEPVDRPALQNTKPAVVQQSATRPTNQQIVKQDVQAREAKTNKSAELRHDLSVASQKRKERFQQEAQSNQKRKQKLREEANNEATRKARNKKLELVAAADRAHRKKLATEHDVELKKKRLAFRAEIYTQDKKRALKVQEANTANAKSSAKSAAIRQAAIKGVHANKIDPNAAAALGTSPLVTSAPQIGEGGGGGADIGAAAVGGGGGGDGGGAVSTGGGGGGGGGSSTN